MKTREKKVTDVGHRSGVGGMWEEIGRLQFDFLVEKGLKPSHYLLDIGCGSLRGGVHFIRYLEAGHYIGLDKSAPLLKAGQEIELKREGLVDKDPVFILSDHFDLTVLPKKMRFDYMLAQSVFTHLMPEQILYCLISVAPRLRLTGALYATFWLSKFDGITHGAPHPKRKGEKRFVRYVPTDLERIAAKAGLKIRFIGEWGHPRGQLMMEIDHQQPAKR